jgi:putative modified peptide
MADTSLTKEQGLLLLGKLAQDDAFRAHFEQKPAEAMFRMGIPPDLICCLPAKCLCPAKLGSKDAMEEARKGLAGDLDSSVLNFIVPQAGFGQSKP